MAVAHDVTTLAAAFATATTQNTTHTPSGTPKGVVVQIAQDLSTTDELTSTTAVTYGGVTMQRVHKDDRATTLGCNYTYFLGANIPTGAQTVAITSSGTSNKRAQISTVTAAANTYVSRLATAAAATANPSLTVDPGTGIQAVVFYLLSVAVATTTTAVTGTPTPTHSNVHDFGSEVAMWARSVNTGSLTIGYTVSAAQWVHTGIAISEVGAGSSLDTLTDPFDTIGAAWAQAGTPDATVSGGQLSTPAGSVLRAASFYDAQEHAAILEIVTYPTAGSVLILLDSKFNYVYVYREAGGTAIDFGENLDSVGGVKSEFVQTFNATNMRWVRIRLVNHQWLFDTSPDRTTWTNQLTTTRRMDSSVKAQTGSDTGTGVVDNFNTVASAVVRRRRRALMGVGL